MNTHGAKRRWSGPPLALQIMALLLGGLVVAQLVTLALTLLLPPEPQRQYDLSDIAGVLTGAEFESGKNPRALQRGLQAKPPEPSGPGWLTSERSRHDLAQLLGRNESDVRLYFFTPLPFAGTARALPRGLDQNTSGRRPENRAFASARQVHSSGASLDISVPMRSGFIRVDFQVAQGMPGGGYSGAPGGGFGAPGGFSPSDGFSRNGSNGNAVPMGGRDAASSTRAAPSDTPRQPESPANPGAPSSASPASAPAPAAPAVGSSPGGSTTPSAPGAAAQNLQPATGVGAVPGNAPSSGTPRDVGQPSGATPSPMNASPPTAPRTLPLTQTVRSSSQPASLGPREPLASSGTRSEGAARAAPNPPPAGNRQPEESARNRPPTVPGTAPLLRPPTQPVAPAATGQTETVAVTAPARGLFGLAPAPFVEGDFIAAVRLADGSWATAQPRAEPFPNTWQRRVLLWFLLASLIVAPAGWWFSRRLVRPIAGFSRAAEQLGRDPLAPILALQGPAEVGRAAQAFNSMQSRLRSFVDDRTVMIGAISHDLRTPLTRMRFRIEDVPDDQRPGMLADVEEMEQMITSVMNFVRDASEPGARERLDLSTIVEDVVEDAQFVGNSVRLERAENAVVDVDVIAIRRLLANLVDNAVKYGEQARVRLFIDQQEAVAEVSDSGPGLAETELERVFQPFYRTREARASGKTGSGMGLAACRSIARAHGGEVQLKPGARGLVAQMRLPLG